MVDKVKYVIIIFVIGLCLFPFSIKAETLDQYIAKAEKALNESKQAREKKTMTEQEKKKALAEKETLTNEIIKTNNEIKKLTKSIKETEDSIKNKDIEIKQIMKFVQISSGESLYLEYAFGAKTFTDFIYRMSVAEQLSSYNDSLINEYNKEIKELGQKQKELAVKEVQLKEKQKKLEALINKLSKEIDELNDTAQSSSDEYKNFMKYVDELLEMGCKGYEDMAKCRARLAPPVVKPPVTKPDGGGSGDISGGVASGYYIPLAKGKVTQNYYGKKHNAIDITNYEGAPVYAITGGKVRTISHAPCGRNIVYIVHNVGGTMYTTVYYHLKTVTVSAKQNVQHTTQIGTQGGNPSYDSCTTGSHVDFKLFKGEYLVDFFSLTSGPHMDPRAWLPQLPKEGQRFYNR